MSGGSSPSDSEGGGGRQPPAQPHLDLPLVIGSLSNHHHDKTTTTSKNSYFQQNHSSARASIFFVHFFDDYCTTTTWNLLMRRFLEDVDMRWSIFLSLFEPGYKVLKNSTPRKIAYIWHIEQVQIDALKFERRQIHLFSDVFTAVVAIVDTCLSSLYHWIDLKNEHDLWTKGL